MSRETPTKWPQVIPYGRQTIGDEEIQAVIDVLKSPFLTQGPAIERFENAVAQYCDVKYAVAFCNGTAALHGACFAAGISDGDEVITSPITFVASSNAVLYQGGKPVFADIQPGTWNIDPAQIHARISSRTKALLPVHFGGLPVDLEQIYQIANEHKFIVIEDACHALGARYQGKPIGHCRDMAVFSFHPVKSITTGEGGMVVTSNPEFYEKLLMFRTHGITKNSTKFQQFDGLPWEYEMQALGYNYRMTDIQAAVGTVQMVKLDGFIESRNHLAKRYHEAFQSIPGIECQMRPDPTGRSAYHLFVIRFDPTKIRQSRQTIFEGLIERNIRPQVHYIPVHLQPYYQTHLKTHQGDFPEAERYYNNCISLPLYPTLTESAQDFIIEQVIELATR